MQLESAIASDAEAATRSLDFMGSVSQEAELKINDLGILRELAHAVRESHDPRHPRWGSATSPHR